MHHMSYVLGAWGVVLISGVLYTLRLVIKGRRLTTIVDPARQRWMTTPDAKTDSDKSNISDK